MAMDFPASPTNGQVFVFGGIAYTWNGYAWVGGGQPAAGADAPSDGGEYVRVNGVWRLKEQNFTPVGTILDVTVPANARMAKIVAYLYPTTATATQAAMVVSADGTNFCVTLNDYYYAGFIHGTGNAVPSNVINVPMTGASSLPLIPGNSTSTNDIASIIMTLQLIRPAPATNWNAHIVSHVYLSPAAQLNSDFIYRGYITGASAAGSALALKILRFSFNGANTYAAGTSINIAWVY